MEEEKAFVLDISQEEGFGPMRRGRAWPCKWDTPPAPVRCGVCSSGLRGTCEDLLRKNLQGQENWVLLPVARPRVPPSEGPIRSGGPGPSLDSSSC